MRCSHRFGIGAASRGRVFIVAIKASVVISDETLLYNIIALHGGGGVGYSSGHNVVIDNTICRFFAAFDFPCDNFRFRVRCKCCGR